MSMTATHKTSLQSSYSSVESSVSSELMIALELLEGEMSSKRFFPPVSSPGYVKEAFDSLSKEERLDIQWLTLTMYASKNLRKDELGRLTVLHSGDPDYINITEVLEAQGFNYAEYIEELVDYTKELQSLVSKENYLKWNRTVHKFKHVLLTLTANKLRFTAK